MQVPCLSQVESRSGTNQDCDGGDDEAEVVRQVLVIPGLALNKKGGPCELSCHGCQTEDSCCQPKIAYLLRHDFQFPLQCCALSACHTGLLSCGGNNM